MSPDHYLRLENLDIHDLILNLAKFLKSQKMVAAEDNRKL